MAEFLGYVLSHPAVHMSATPCSTSVCWSQRAHSSSFIILCVCEGPYVRHKTTYRESHCLFCNASYNYSLLSNRFSYNVVLVFSYYVSPKTKQKNFFYVLLHFWLKTRYLNKNKGLPVLPAGDEDPAGEMWVQKAVNPAFMLFMVFMKKEVKNHIWLLFMYATVLLVL